MSEGRRRQLKEGLGKDGIGPQARLGEILSFVHFQLDIR